MHNWPPNFWSSWSCRSKNHVDGSGVFNNSCFFPSRFLSHTLSKWQRCSQGQGEREGHWRRKGRREAAHRERSTVRGRVLKTRVGTPLNDHRYVKWEQNREKNKQRGTFTRPRRDKESGRRVFGRCEEMKWGNVPSDGAEAANRRAQLVRYNNVAFIMIITSCN